MNISRSLITRQWLAGLKNLKPDQLICGEEHHPRRLPRKAMVPESMRDHLNRSAFVEIAYCSQGACIITLDDFSYKLKPGDLCLWGGTWSIVVDVRPRCP